MSSSFSNQVKDELARLELNAASCQLSELEAVVRSCGTLYFKGKGVLELTIRTLHAGCARRAFRMLRELYAVHAQVMVQRRRRLGCENVYVTRIPDQPALTRLVADLHILEGSNLCYRIAPERVNCTECRAAYLRGCFLGTGSITHPESQHHLELTFTNEQFAREVIALMARHDIDAGLTQRESRLVVYVKQAETVVDFLRLTGAYNAVFEYEDVRIYKELRNRVNRLVNAETANVAKIVDAALRQLEAIRTIERFIGLQELRPTLREIARARLRHPELSMRDLGRRLEPAIGKSAVSYRLRELQKIADRLRQEAGRDHR